MAGDDDQFSFPVVSNQIYQSVQSSPSLWRISSRVYHHDEEFADVRSGLDEASVAAAEEEEKEVDGGGREEDLEEKMDLLWEDFNREEKKEEEAKTMSLCLLHALNASRGIGSRGRTSTRRPTMVVMAKLLKKKLRLIRRSALPRLKKNKL